MCASSIVSLKTYPVIFLKDGGRDSWVAVIISSIILIICYDYIIRIWINRDCHSLKEVFESGCGKFLGKIFLSLFAGTLFFTIVECAVVETDIIHFNLFIESPQWYVLFFIILPGIYVVKKGKNAVIVTIIFAMVISIINGINLYFLTFPYKKYNRLFPLFENGLNYGFFIAVIKSLGLFATAAIALVYLSEVKKTKKLRLCTLISTIFIAQMIISSITGILATFTVERAAAITFPKLIQTQLISYFGFIANGEFYVIFQVLAGWLAKYIITFFALLIILRELRIDKLFNMNVLPYSISALVYVIAYVISNNLLSMFQFVNVYCYTCLINFLIIPIVIFTIFAIRTKHKNSKCN
jgi:spore germination protein (amino acid permease)